MYRTSGSGSEPPFLTLSPALHPSLLYLSLVQRSLPLRVVCDLFLLRLDPHTPQTLLQRQAHTETHAHSYVCVCVRLLTCSHVIRFILTCFHVTKFDFVSQTTRHNESGNNNNNNTSITTTIATTRPTKLWPLNWPRANRDTGRQSNRGTDSELLIVALGRFTQCICICICLYLSLYLSLSLCVSVSVAPSAVVSVFLLLLAHCRCSVIYY